MRYVEIVHRYVVPVPEAAPADPQWDSLCNAAVSVMENHMTKLNPNMRDLVTSWQTMPIEYAPVSETQQTGTVHRGRMPSDEELQRMSVEGVSFVDDIMGGVGQVQHPHDQGVRFFPEGHPLFEAETKVIEDAEVIKEDPKQLEAGKEDDDQKS